VVVSFLTFTLLEENMGELAKSASMIILTKHFMTRAYMGNQQFTASGLYFEEAETAIQIHWDWGWTMQNIVVDNCKTGFIIVGGAGGVSSHFR
jgi:hypothetical protein